jgi:hypothetical protein
MSQQQRSCLVTLALNNKIMETYLILIAFAVVLNSINAGKVLLILLLKIFYPNATIKEIENFIKNTKTKFSLPKLWK